MSRDFEKEYRQMIDAEIPDLWERIEARLPEQEGAIPAKESEVVAFEQRKEKSPSGEGKRGTRATKKFLSRRNMGMAAMAAAAVFCVMTAGPMMTRKSMEKSPGGDAAGSPQSEHGSAVTDMVAFIKDQMQGTGPAADAASNYAPDESPYTICSDNSYYAEETQDNDNAPAHQGIQSETARPEQSNVKTDENMGEQEPEGDSPATNDTPSGEEIKAARAAAEKYYKQTVFDVIYMEVKTLTKNQIVFIVHCSRDGEIVDPDRTVEVTFDGEQWEVTNEGY